MPETAAAAAWEYFAFEVGAGYVASSWAYTAVYVVTAVAINQVANKVLAGSSGQGGTASPQVLSTTVRQAAAARRLAYGTVKMGGVMNYAAQSDSGEYMWFSAALCEGPIEGIDPVFWLGDELSNNTKFAGLTYLEAYTGAPGQAASAELVANSNGEWTTDDVGTGVAYAVWRLKHNREAFPRGRANLPIAFLVRGRNVFDPRTGLTAFSNNPALCLLDFMRSEFGPAGGIPDDLIDFDSFAAAANVCDEIIDSIDPTNVVSGVPGKVRRYTLDGVFEVSGGHTAIVRTMLDAMAGQMATPGERYRLYAGAWRAPTGPALTSEYLRSVPSYRTHPAYQQRINTARGTYREPRQDWQMVDYAEQQLPEAVVSEYGEILQNINLPATSNGAIAQRLARLAMMRARSAVPLVVQCNYGAMRWDLLDVLTADLPECGAQGVYVVSSYTYAEGGGIDMVLTPQPASDFDWVPAEHERIVTTVVAPDFNSTPPEITGLVVTAGVTYVDESVSNYGLLATWNATADVYLENYEVQFRVVGSGDAGWRGQIAPSNSWKETLNTGTSYDVRVRIVRTDSTTGPWATETSILVSGDTTPPGVPTDLTITGTGTHTIGWKNPASLDVMRGRVYGSTVNNAAGATEVAEVFGLPSTAYTASYTPAVTPLYYWVAAVDRSGNESTREYVGVGS